MSPICRSSEKVKFLTESNLLVAHIVAIKEEVAPTVEAATEEAAAGPAEPEVIKKGKGEAEGEEKEGKEGKEAKEGKKEGQGEEVVGRCPIAGACFRLGVQGAVAGDGQSTSFAPSAF